MFGFFLLSALEGAVLLWHINNFGPIKSFTPVNLLFFADSILFLGLYLISGKSKKSVEKKKTYLKFTSLSLISLLVFYMIGINVQGSVFFANKIDKQQIEKKVTDVIVKPSVEPTKQAGTVTTQVDTLRGIAKGKNVIVIQIEAFQNIVIGKTMNGVEITPNLNKLIKESVYFKNAISQIASGNTSDAEFMLNTSLYPIEKESPFKKYTNKDYKGLPYIMKKNGYYSASFHTNDATFWNRKNMYPSLGFNRWYDKKDFPNQEIVGYGASDRILYDKVVEKLLLMRSKRMPAYYNVITLSNHFPFKTPDWMKTVKYGKGVDGTPVGQYLKTANYSDRQLGIFFDKLKKENLYNDAVIILYGDHFGISTKTEADKANIKKFLGRNYDGLDTFNIPLIFKLPNNARVGTFEMPAGQIDIMPTILNLVGIENKDRKMYGQDLMNTKENVLGLRFYASANSYVDNSGLYTGTGKYFNFSHTRENKAPDITKRNKLYSTLAENDKYLKKLPIIKK